MKRGKPHQGPYMGGESSKSSEDDPAAGKGKMWFGEEESGGDMDELLEVLGYKVRSSDMADVANKLEQLEMALGASPPEAISFDTVHYNPADLSSWVHSMLSELTPSDDLRAIPGVAAYPPPAKRIHPSDPSPSRPVILADTQEAGVCLVQTLLACAEAVQRDDLALADALVKRVGTLAAAQPGGAMRKVATYFAEALARRIYNVYPTDSALGPTYTDALETHFYESCPYLKFAHFTANQAILEAFASAPRVHVIDFGLKQGMQWPALLQALALRPGGPPAFSLTGIGPPQPDGSDSLQQVGWKLAVLAETVGVDFKFRGFVASSLADIEPEMLGIGPVGDGEEVVAVNSVFELHRLLGRPGGIEKVLSSVKAMRPKIVTVVEQEVNHNGPVFQDRFTEALHYYSSLFDSLEGSSGSVAPPPSQDLVMSELYLGRQICNVVACEGADRVERHEPLTRWRGRMESGGFQPVLLGSNAYRQASMLLALFAGGDGYRVEESNGCLMLGWHTRPLIATSAWRIASLG